MATENIMLAAVTAGGDRQDICTQLSANTARRPASGETRKESPTIFWSVCRPIPRSPEDDPATLDPSHFVGRAPEQVEEFLAEIIAPIRERYAELPPPGELWV